MGQTVQMLTARLRYGREDDPPATALARDARGVPVGFVGLTFSRWDNTHLAGMVVTVDPLRRRQGLGRALFEAGLARVRQQGRTVLLGYGVDTPALRGFATAMGMDSVFTVAESRQDLRTVDSERLDRECAAAGAHATAYELVRLAGRTPEEMLPAVVAMTAAINDAPTEGMAVDAEAFSAERIRAYERCLIASGQRLYRLVARHRDTGELAGHTVVGVEEQRPWCGSQHDTSVVRAHRGHRLGLLLKIGMLRWLAEVEPQLHHIDTNNAASNTHMIRVNELLGYQRLATVRTWQCHL
jgi:RimJ/RimL family protein N-acetyltransferase